VKTHRLPLDAQPAIYVVRDGRSAVLSYQDYYQERFPQYERTLSQIISGDDVYGSWSDHINIWTRQHKGPLLVLQFAELVEATSDTVQRIAEFIGHEGDIKPWVNPREELQKKIPWFVRDGASIWQPRSPWNDHFDRLFYTFHGDVMQRLGFYSTGEQMRQQQDAFNVPYMQLAETIRDLVKEKQFLQKTCDERQQVITELTKGWSGQINRYISSLNRRLGKK
jgi:hypothetical protein